MHRFISPPELVAAAASAVAAIADDLREPSTLTPERFAPDSGGEAHFPVTLGWGWPGIALFYAYLHRAYGRAQDLESCLRYIDLGLEQLAQQPVGPSLYHGYTGHAWLTRHLGGWILPAETSADSNATVDRMLAAMLARRPAHLRMHDLLQGLLGVGVYALEAPASGASADLLAALLAALDAAASRSAHGIVWHTSPSQCLAAERSAFPQGFSSLGLAHGTAGVIAVLSAMVAHGLEPPRSRRLTEAAVEFVLHQREWRPPGSNFPLYAGNDRMPRVARAAWCHGDPGIAVALQLAGRRLGRPDWTAIGTEIARQAAGLSAEEAGVLDATLCHGAAGLALLCRRQFELSGDPALARAALTWTERVLSFRRPGTGIGGFTSRLAGAAPAFSPLPGLLPGAAGIGLVLLAVATSVGSAWDRILLLSSPADGSSEPAAPAEPVP